MALVHVADHRVDAQRPERAEAADAQHDLLPDAHLLVAAVELVGDVLVVGRVLGHVRVEQVEGHPADLDPPDLDEEPPAGEVDLDAHRGAVGAGRDCRGRL